MGNSGRPIEVTHPPIAKKGNAGRKIIRVLYDTAVYGVSGAVGAHSLATTFSGQEFNEGSVLFGLAGAIIGGGKAVAKEIKDSGTQHGTTWVYRQQDKATVVHELDRSMGFPPGFCGDALARLNQKFL